MRKRVKKFNLGEAFKIMFFISPPLGIGLILSSLTFGKGKKNPRGRGWGSKFTINEEEICKSYDHLQIKKKNEEDYENFEISPILLKMKNYL